MEHSKSRIGFVNLTVKAMAHITEAVARNNKNGQCFVIMHKPKEPMNYEMRLKSLKRAKNR